MVFSYGVRIVHILAVFSEHMESRQLSMKRVSKNKMGFAPSVASHRQMIGSLILTIIIRQTIFEDCFAINVM